MEPTFLLVRYMQLGNPDSKIDGADMGLIWGRQEDQDQPHVGPKNFAIREVLPGQP